MESHSSERPIYFTVFVLRSRAYAKLTSAQIRVLNEFYIKRQVKKRRNRKKRKPVYDIINNGKIIFPARKGSKKLGMSEATFKRAIRKLILVGFIDVDHVGGGLQGDCHTYSISKRWELFETEDFVYKEPPKGSHGTGFTFDNWEERTGRQRRK